MKLLVVCRSFDNMAGGVERMATTLMNEMCNRGHEVALLTWDQDDARAFYNMNGDIHWYKLALGDHLDKAGWRLRFKRALKVRRMVKDAHPDIILCFQHGTFLSTRLFTSGMNIPVICAERNAPSRFQFIKAGKKQALIFQTFRLASAITIQCESYRQDYPAYLRDKITTIPNPVLPAPCTADPAGKDGNIKTLLSIGRLNYQKNYPVLIKAFAQLAEDFPDWRLVIVGEGEDRPDLEKLIAARGLAERVSLPGVTKDVDSYYCNSHVLCLPSRWEGFPNVLAEAMARGLPAVGFAECAGVRDLIQDGETGCLAVGMEDSDTLASALRTLMNSPDKRVEMGKAGAEYVKQFAPDKVYDLWEDFLLSIAFPKQAKTQ